MINAVLEFIAGIVALGLGAMIIIHFAEHIILGGLSVIAIIGIAMTYIKIQKALGFPPFMDLKASIHVDDDHDENP